MKCAKCPPTVDLIMSYIFIFEYGVLLNIKKSWTLNGFKSLYLCTSVTAVVLERGLWVWKVLMGMQIKDGVEGG